MNDINAYERLARHLDRLPAGFPRTESGVELKILQKLFTPQEAQLAVLLSLKPESVEDIAERAQMPPEELALRLEEMARKGLIFRLRKGSEARYMAAQFVIGIWEYHVNALDEELIALVNEYIPVFFKKTLALNPPSCERFPYPAPSRRNSTSCPTKKPAVSSRSRIRSSWPLVSAERSTRWREKAANALWRPA
ncbi:hypothetical protein [Desulfosoma sp.]|uniref:hypothetical protein n=1 Tax=Desulfosoma sp. TaxID=2603217 RepID=UPI004049688E